MKDVERAAQPESVLCDAGFERVGNWVLDKDTIALQGDIPTAPGVYAHVVDGHVFYIGVASMGLKGRLHFYAKPGPTQRTSIRINGLIRQKLASGHEVWVVAAFPNAGVWNGLPVDTVTGLEAGLIREIRPPWNKRGVS